MHESNRTEIYVVHTLQELSPIVASLGHTFGTEPTRLLRQKNPAAEAVTWETLVEMFNAGGALVLAAYAGKLVGLGALVSEYRINGAVAVIGPIVIDSNHAEPGLEQRIKSGLLSAAQEKQLRRVEYRFGTRRMFGTKHTTQSDGTVSYLITEHRIITVPAPLFIENR